MFGSATSKPPLPARQKPKLKKVLSAPTTYGSGEGSPEGSAAGSSKSWPLTPGPPGPGPSGPSPTLSLGGKFAYRKLPSVSEESPPGAGGGRGRWGPADGRARLYSDPYRPSSLQLNGAAGSGSSSSAGSLNSGDTPVSSTAAAVTSPPAYSTSRKQPVVFACPTSREMEYVEREHPRHAFDYLKKIRERGDLCDVTLVHVASSREIRAHKVVLAACSPYFESMFIGEFAEPGDIPIEVEEIEENALELLVDFAYTSRIKLTDQNVYTLFEASDLLQFMGVRNACFRFFKVQMNKSNCIRTWLFAEDHSCTELIDASLKYVECNFLDIVKGREYLNLEHPDLVGKVLSLEDIAVTSEEQVYEAALGWLRHLSDRRKEHAATVFKNIRFPNISREYLLHIVDNEPLIKDDPDCLQQLIDALSCHVTAVRTTLRKSMAKQQYHGPSYTNLIAPRAASMAVELIEVQREGKILGLRIMGGSERPNHVFRQGDKPGIFILQVTSDGAAAKSGKLRSGDRILEVNGMDVSGATHEVAIRLLRVSSDPLSLLVRHEPPPKGLMELTLVTKPGEGFGFSIAGGVNGYPGNPLDETDEGIFIVQIIPGGTAQRDGRLSVGTRILQVNSISLLGKTYDEVMLVLHGVLDRINLLVCHGFEASALSQTIDTVDEFGYVGSEPPYQHLPLAALQSPDIRRSTSTSR